MEIVIRPVRLGLPGDSEGATVFRDGALIAILAQLGEDHDEQAGTWHVEAVFGPSLNDVSLNFRDLKEAAAYFEGLSG